MTQPPDRPLERSRLLALDLRAAWDENAAEFVAWARRPGHDSYWQFHRDLFLELLPEPGRRTLDLGCGEGRLARDLKRRDHDVVGVDASRTMVAAARQADPELDVRLADASELPFEDADFDLVVAFMSLQDVDEFELAIAESARVLDARGHLCLAIVHPLSSAGHFEEEDANSPFVVRGSYLERSYYMDSLRRDGLEVTFASAHRPLQAYTDALADAGLLIERVREPAVPEPLRTARSRRWQRLPLFLHVRAVKR